MSRAAGVQPAPAVPGNQYAEQMEILSDFVKDFQGGNINFGPLGNALIETAARLKKNDKK